MKPELQRISAIMEQRSAHMRDSKRVKVPMMDLFLLVNLAEIGIKAMGSIVATEELYSAAKLLADAVVKPGQEPGYAAAVFAATCKAVVLDRYTQYLLFGPVEGKPE